MSVPMSAIFEMAGYGVAIILGMMAFRAHEGRDRFRWGAIWACLIALVTNTSVIRFDLLRDLRLKHDEVLAITSRPGALTLMEQYVAASDAATTSGVQFLEQNLKRSVTAFGEAMGRLRQGRFLVDTTEIGAFSLEVLERAEHSVTATSYVNPAKWWETPWGRRYLDLNCDLAEQGVRIRRYVIFQEKEELSGTSVAVRR